MTKPVYHHPEFVVKISAKISEEENKRLSLSLIIDKACTESIIVILKNPSRATKDISDKTIYNVTSYIHKNRDKYSQLKNIGEIIILNVIPYYETYSDQLMNKESGIIDKANIRTIKKLTAEHKNVIIAWGNHPKGLEEEYKDLTDNVLSILQENKNKVFYVDKLTIKGNPKHGMVWAYDNELKRFEFG